MWIVDYLQKLTVFILTKTDLEAKIRPLKSQRVNVPAFALNDLSNEMQKGLFNIKPRIIQKTSLIYNRPVWQPLYNFHKTQFEIKCRCHGHRITKKFRTIFQMLVAKPKLWKIYICISNFFAEQLENALSCPWNWSIQEKFTEKIDTLFARWWFFSNGWRICLKKQKRLKYARLIINNCWTLGIFISWCKNVFS